jgi:alcohol dehydrogenase (cytochrome c)
MSRIILLAAIIQVLSWAQSVDAGKKLFEARCGACHGADGAGGERGPNIVDARRGRAPSKESLREVIKNGIPEAGMPAFSFSDPDMDAVLNFIGSLTAPAIDRPVPGDVAAGAQFFFGKQNCSGCHMIQGRGGVLGPDLSNLGRERRLSQIQQALRNPQAIASSGQGEAGTSYRVVSVRITNNRVIRGIAKNETNFDLQILGLDGTMHLLDKKQISGIERETKSLMPPVHATDDEMQNLVAFLSRLNTAKPPELPPATVRTESNGISFADIATPRPGEWPTYNGQLGGNRHSSLKEINAANVSQLAPKWMFTLPNARRLEVTPVVVEGVMYIAAANEAFALDARTGRQIWHYQRPLTKGVIGDASSAINRGVAVLGDKVFMVTDHAHMLALHRANGQLLWETEMADFKDHYGTTSAPLVVNDLVMTGTSGGDEGARGFIAAYKVSNGELAWKHWTMPAPGEPGSETWIGRAIEHGCAAPWLTGSYDPELKLLYWTTGNPCPDYNGDERKGDNLYTSSVIAMDPVTGKRHWHFQFTPHDLHDWDAAQPVLVVNANFRGQPRKLLVQANRNGFFYVLDRATGEFLLGEPFVKKITWASGIGPDGRPKLLPNSEPTAQGTKACPAVEGATNWMSSSYSPGTGLFYVMSLERCSIYSKSSAWWEPGKSFYGGGTRRVPGENGEKILRAIDIQSGKIAWEYPQIGPANSWGGVLSTDGGLVFFGEDSGAFAALDAKTGKPQWNFQTSQLWKASPMTYQVAGKQFISVASGGTILAFGLP